MYKPGYTSESFQSFKQTLRGVITADKQKEEQLVEESGGRNKTVIGIVIKMLENVFSGMFGVQIYPNWIVFRVKIPKPHISKNLIIKLKNALLSKLNFSNKKESVHEEKQGSMQKIDKNNRKIIIEIFELIMSKPSDIKDLLMDEDEESISIEFKFPVVSLKKVKSKLAKITRLQGKFNG